LSDKTLSDLREAYPGAFKKVAGALPPLQQKQQHHDPSSDLKKCDKKPEKPKCYGNMG
jgi:hypothetical protein